MKTTYQFRKDFLCEFTEKDTEEEAIRNDRILSFFLSQRSQDIEEIKRWAEKAIVKESLEIAPMIYLSDLLSFLNSLK